MSLETAPFDRFVTDKLERHLVPGMAVGLARDGQPILLRGYGWRDREAGLPVEADTVFGIASCTKSITCAAILRLNEMGRLTLGDPVTRHLPEFRTRETTRRPVTLHHLMTHTSGLAPQPALLLALLGAFEGDPAADGEEIPAGAPIETSQDLMAFLARSEIPLLGEPGEHFSYSNDGYALLGAVVERASGLSYEAFVAAELLTPLGMTRTTFRNPLVAGLGNVATLYARRDAYGQDEVYPAPKWWDAPAMVAAGFLRSTVPDLLRYLSLFVSGGRGPDGRRILSEESVRAMLTPKVPFLPGRGYGYGFVLWEDFHGRTLAEHSGGLKGVGAHVALVPEEGLAAAALANLEGAPAGHVALGALALAMGAPMEAPRLSAQPPVSLDGRRLRPLVGTYRSGEGVRVVVDIDGGELVCELHGRRYPARAVGDDAFVLSIQDDDVYLRFLGRGTGVAERLAFGSRILYRGE